MSATEGVELDLTANLTSSEQFRAIMESHAHSNLGSEYITSRVDLLKRLTCSYEGRHRSDIVAIGKGYDDGKFFGRDGGDD